MTESKMADHDVIPTSLSGKVSDLEELYGRVSDDVSVRTQLTRWLRKRRARCTCRRLFLSNFPIVTALKSYRPLKHLPSDVISGLTVGVMQIPQGMAFSALATLPPITGLHVALVASVVYALIGGSRQASVGVISVVCLMIGSVLDREVLPDPHTVTGDVIGNNVTNVTLTSFGDYEIRKIKTAAAVSFISGVFLMCLGKLGFGLVTTFMPDALIRGFTTGAATHVALSQASNILGVKIPRHNGPLKAVMTLYELCCHLTETNWVPLVISIVAMAIMYMVRVHINQRYRKRLRVPVPIELIIMIVSIVVSKYGHLQHDYSLNIVGDIPTGLPAPTFPDLRLAKGCVTDALTIGMVAFVQSVALAKTFATKNGYSIDPDQEMFAYGVCSAVSSLFSGMVAAASMARSIVQDATGGVSQLASLVGCVIVLLVVLLLGPLFYHLPICILSSVIVVNLRGMFRQFLLVMPYWTQSKYDSLLFVATYVGVVVLDVDIGLGVGVAVAVLSVVVRTQRASVQELGQLDDLNIYKPVKLYNKTATNSTTRVLRFESPLYFANTEAFVRRLHRLLGVNIAKLKKQRAAKTDLGPSLDNKAEDMQTEASANGAWSTASPSNLCHVILDMSGTVFLDTMGAGTLKQVILDFEAVGIELYVVGLPESCYPVLKPTDVWEKCKNHFYVSVNDVMADLKPFSCRL